MFLPFGVEERSAIRQGTLKNPMLRPKRFPESVVRKKKRNALSKVILGFASAREARDNHQDDILALLILTYTHKILEASSFMVYTV